MSGRNGDGTFAVGNTGGPGRPRRAIERDYLAALGETVTLADWREVCQKALAQAKDGDARARDWLTRYVLGEDAGTLQDVAADQVAGRTTDGMVLVTLAESMASHWAFLLLHWREWDWANRSFEEFCGEPEQDTLGSEQ
ncbi:MAG TPA: hypothetical protein VK395_23605 [Gemmataceae bacterium]|nr:hypothetical protein [Gemmataceae bacterium]